MSRPRILWTITQLIDNKGAIQVITPSSVTTENPLKRKKNKNYTHNIHVLLRQTVNLLLGTNREHVLVQNFCFFFVFSLPSLFLTDAHCKNNKQAAGNFPLGGVMVKRRNAPKINSTKTTVLAEMSGLFTINVYKLIKWVIGLNPPCTLLCCEKQEVTTRDGNRKPVPVEN